MIKVEILLLLSVKLLKFLRFKFYVIVANNILRRKKLDQQGKNWLHCLGYILPSKHSHYLPLTVTEILCTHQGRIYSQVFDCFDIYLRSQLYIYSFSQFKNLRFRVEIYSLVPANREKQHGAKINLKKNNLIIW